MSLSIIIALLLGIFSGYYFIPENIISNSEILITIALNILILSVGIDVGSNKSLIENLKKKGLKLLCIPLCIVAGSVVGGLITGLFFKVSPNISLAIASGFGWYSLSGIILTSLCNVEVGTIAFLTNIFRELIAVITIPFLARYLNYYTTIAPAGATSMDTTLPLISESTNSETAFISFVNGLILSSLVPVLVPFFYSIYK
ncbi:lysine exporter LysO family protein [Clostridium ganghwense]|uniref:Lysine exporter LysO family protein n=1 Tax=Clostridium ganghwense TaxID=312089 RepID=A0ABT4CSI4_9CLOT|nr:lysine exporter LysO family protein [Clostridium ganghwense]MCY6372007.1 lysine exporter LysO family protein [Clostridium ganghwense]